MTLQERFRREYGHHCQRSFHESINKCGIGRMVIRQTVYCNRTTAVHYPGHWSQRHGPTVATKITRLETHTVLPKKACNTCLWVWGTNMCAVMALPSISFASLPKCFTTFPSPGPDQQDHVWSKEGISFNTSINITFHTTVLQVFPMMSAHCGPLIISKV
jgi:hypothetical protein